MTQRLIRFFGGFGIVPAMLVFFATGTVNGAPENAIPPDSAAKPAAPKAGDSTPAAPAALPGKGLAGHDFFYAGEAKSQNMFIVKKGAVVWSYLDSNSKGEISDAVLMSTGNVVFAHQFGVTEITPDKKVVWNYDAPAGCEIHTAQPIGKEHVLFVQNGSPAVLKVANTVSGKIVKEFNLPVGNPRSVHGQFRHVRLTPEGNLMVAHMDLPKVAEYDVDGKMVWSVEGTKAWSAVPLASGNVLITTSKDVHEVNRKGETVWTLTKPDVPDFKLLNLQLATRLPNGNTLINNWVNTWSAKVDPASPPVQAIELTPDKKVVWALSSWTAPADLGPATTIQLLDDASVIPEDVHFGDIR